ncbi:Type I transmembrane sorting receptor [Arthrobotrys musiformis]|uniref:Type I transmembrane sorting receptor n=1 Tax=Arthrobotrys musiformis TaxID=47236 RepID=A0AAV9WJ71_9PEZI
MFSLLYLFLIFTSQVLAIPVVTIERSHEADGGFSIPIIHNYPKNKDPIDSLRHAYQRYGSIIEAPEERFGLAKRLEEQPRQKDQIQDQSTAIVSATPTNLDVEYWCPVKIGKNTLNLNFDTGSNSLWVFSSVTPADQRGTHNLYFPGISSLKKNGFTWGISYADDSKASGVVFMDTVQVGSATVTSQAIQAATAVTENFVKNSAVDGLFGLGYARLNSVSPERTETWFANAMKTLKSSVFTADLRPGAVGAYTFGYIDPSRYTGSITYQPLHRNSESKGWWIVDAIKGYKIGGEEFSDVEGSGGGAVLDTGTTLLLMSEKVVKNYYSKVPSSVYDIKRGGWVFPCSSTIPELQVPFGDAFAIISPKYMIHTTFTSQSKELLCFGSLQSLGETRSHLPYIYGDSFFKANYVIFDMKNSKVGFATKRS